MSLDPERALQAAVLAHLLADTGLTALLGDPPRIHDQPPAQPVYPYALIGRAEARPWGGLDGEGTEHLLTLTVVSQFEGAEEAKAIVAAIRALLHEADLTLTDHRLVNLRTSFADVFRAADWRSTYGVLRLRAVTEPL